MRATRGGTRASRATLPGLDSVVSSGPRPVAAIARCLLRFRCPHCGHGRVIKAHFNVHDHCDSCGFRFRRDDDPHYFNGAIFVNYMMSAGLFVLSFFLVVMASLPSVPWDAIAIVAPIGAIVSVLALQPVGKMIWLITDVRIRPVTADELVPLG